MKSPSRRCVSYSRAKGAKGHKVLVTFQANSLDVFKGELRYAVMKVMPRVSSLIKCCLHMSMSVPELSDKGVVPEQIGKTQQPNDGVLLHSKQAGMEADN